jgi:hypothetical protein
LYLGIPKYWFFNSKKEKGNLIFKKNTDKLNFPCIIQSLGHIITEREKSDNLIYLKDFLNPMKHVLQIFFFYKLNEFIRKIRVCL